MVELAQQQPNSTPVYIRSERHGWIPALQLKTFDGKATVSVPKSKDEKDILYCAKPSPKFKYHDNQVIELKDYPDKVLPMQNVDSSGMVEDYKDMADLPFLHEAAILYNLKYRHVREKPYTRAGDMIVAMNPYTWLHELYSEEKRAYYSNRLVWDLCEEDPRATMEPHVYEVSALSYKNLVFGGVDQSILVSGESGAGKTETVKICLGHIASVQRGKIPPGYFDRGDVDPVVQRIVESNPLLEAFGNAKTCRNDNSSRFGKFLRLQFDRNAKTKSGVLKSSRCGLVGSKCDVYLLEKNRVVGHSYDERTFHIFYQLLAASDEKKTQYWEGLRGKTNASFKYVGTTSTTSIEGIDDRAALDDTIKALELLGISGPKLHSLMSAICITLQLGNIEFKPMKSNSDASVVSNDIELGTLADLMGVPCAELEGALTNRTFKTAKETHRVPLNEEAAKEACDALAKEVYQKAFLWLVSMINKATSAAEADEKKLGTISLLDIFGFESFEINRFEQLCINYANEKLQQKFTQDVFENVKLEYKSEGVSLDDVHYDDNRDVLNLIEGPTGLLALLNEECIRPKGNDFDFVQKALQINAASPALQVNRTDRLSFAINHYAQKVMYDAEMFVVKNLDTLPTDLQDCVQLSSNEIVNSPRCDPLPAKRKSIGNRFAGTQSNINAPTVWTKYKTQLTALMTSLRTTQSRYIRCIKPNCHKRPQLLEHNQTIAQLRCAGVISGITISRSCYPNKLPNSVVLARFSSFADPKNFPSRKTSEMSTEQKNMEDCKALMRAALVSKKYTTSDGRLIDVFTVGRTKTFFRAGALEFLESQRTKGKDAQAIIIQKAARGWLSRNGGKHKNQMKKAEEARRLAAELAEAERCAKLERDRDARLEVRQGKLKEMKKQLDNLEFQVTECEVKRLETIKKLVTADQKRKKELEDLKEAVHGSELQRINERNAVKAMQEKQLEENTKLILYLKAENKRVRKEQAKYRMKYENESSTNGVLEQSNRDMSETIGMEEELTIMEKTHLGALKSDYEMAKDYNRDMKAKFRGQQNEYLLVANERLSLQQCLKQILEIIDKHPSKSNKFVPEINAVVQRVESTAKRLVAELEAAFPGDTAEYTEVGYDD